MRELTMNEMDGVAGGPVVAPVVVAAVAVWIWMNAESIQSAVEGFASGYEKSDKV